MKLVGVSGSLIGMKIVNAVTEILKTAKAIDSSIETELIDLKEYELELFHGPSLAYYNQDTWDLVQKITTADMLVFGSPIYQASYSGVLKNLLDFMPEHAFKNKVTGIVTVAGSEKHFLVSEYQLKPVLTYLKGIVPSEHVFITNESFDEEGYLIDDSISYRVEKLVKEMIRLQHNLDNE